MKHAVKLAARGAAGFGVGALIIIALVLVESVLSNARPGRQPSGVLFMAIIAAFPLCGILGAGALTWKVADSATSRRAMLGFAVGFLVAPWGMLFSLVSLQASAGPEYAWGAIAFGVSFAIAGGIGAAFLGWRLLPAGILGFGIPGAISGALLFNGLGVLLVSNPDASKTLAAAVAVTAFLLPFVVGGAVLGAALARTSRE
jgi:hypothetical protein